PYRQTWHAKSLISIRLARVERGEMHQRRCSSMGEPPAAVGRRNRLSKFAQGKLRDNGKASGEWHGWDLAAACHCWHVASSLFHDPKQPLIRGLLVVEAIGIGEEFHIRAPGRFEIDEGLATVRLTRNRRRIAQDLNARHGLEVVDRSLE